MKTPPSWARSPVFPPATSVIVTGDAYQSFMTAIYKLTGLNLAAYKPDQLQRRLPSLLGRVGVASLAEFTDLLAKDGVRLSEFLDWVGIHVSEFFRDPPVYDFLERQVLPDLLRRRSLLRIWSAGCSVGAEPYSLAILLEEVAPGRPYRIQATDVSPDVLNLARAGGPYKPDLLRSISRPRRDRWFTGSPEGYWIHRDLVGRVRFTRHDLVKDPYPTAVDLVTCRNVTIYFTPRVRDDVVRRLARAVAPGGVLLLGGSEVVANPSDLGLARLAPSCYQRRDFLTSP